MFTSTAVRLPAPEGAEKDTSIRFVMQLGRALQRFGTPAHRLEDAMGAVSRTLGLESRFFSTPTALIASFGPMEAPCTSLVRFDPGETDLGRLVLLDALAADVIQGKRTVAAGLVELDAILGARQPHGGRRKVIGCVLAAVAGVPLFGGGARELLAASVVGLFVGILAALADRHASIGRVFEPTAAFGASALSVLGTRVFGSYATEVTTLSALVYVLPGLTLTLAMTELATRNLVSGTARLTGAALVFLQLVFGVALGRKVDLLLPPAPAELPFVPLPEWTLLPALGVVTVAIALLFRARLRHAGYILLAGALAYGGGRLGARYLGPELGAFAGAVALGIGSNVVSRLRQLPASLMVLPGIMLLVPGSVGYRGLESMMGQDVVAGVGTAFSGMMIAVALAAGILLANSAVQPRRIL